jgi:hypothetical protein
MWEGLTKKWGKKKNGSPSANVGTRGRGHSPSARDKALEEEVPSPSVGSRLSGKRSPSPSPRSRHSGKSFFSIFFCKRLRLMLPSNVTFLFRVPNIPECCAGLPRVSCPFRHSGEVIFPECNTRGRKFTSPVVHVSSGRVVTCRI